MLDPAPRLLVLAAGLGSRYGGAKQIEAVGPGGAWIMDYTIADALRHGFDHVVAVVRPEIRRQVEDHLTPRLGNRAALTLVDQDLQTALPPGTTVPPRRSKPWGTAHAVLVAEEALPGPFAVANADDVYGEPAIRGMAESLSDGPVLIGYPVGETLSPHGGVSRGFCRTDSDGRLVEIREITDLTRDPDGRVRGAHEGRPVELAPDALVSMNLWGLHPSLFPALRGAFARFLSGSEVADGEILLPEVIGREIARGGMRVRVIPRGEGWVGMTHPADRPRVEEELAALGPPAFPTDGASDGRGV